MRVGIVGCGYAVLDRHLPALRRVARAARVVALADPDADALTRAAELSNSARRYASAEELVADPEVETVAICTPADRHAELAIAALDAGKHVLVEKPLTLSLAEADAIVECAAASAAIATVGFNLRYHRLVRRARELVRSGALGRIRSIQTTFTDPLGGRADVPAWRRLRAHGGGALLDKAVHHFDLWRFLLDADVVDVQASIEGSPSADDEAVVVVGRMTTGALATAIASDVTAVHNDVVISGDAAEVRVSLYRFDGVTVAGVNEVPGTFAARIRTATSTLGQAGDALRSIRRGGDFAASYAEQWRQLAAAVRNDEVMETTVVDGREAVAVAVAAAEAAETGRATQVERIERSKVEIT